MDPKLALGATGKTFKTEYLWALHDRVISSGIVGVVYVLSFLMHFQGQALDEGYGMYCMACWAGYTETALMDACRDTTYLELPYRRLPFCVLLT